MASIPPLIVLAASSLHAHDFWLEPASFRPVRSPLAVRLLVGEDFVGDPLPRNPAHIRSFVAHGPQEETPVAGRVGADPAGFVSVEMPGLYVIGYRSHRSTITLDATTFEGYLASEGLERVSALRAERGQSQAGATEVYSRCAKSLVAAGDTDRVATDVSLGFTLELVAEGNPYLLIPGDELPVRLLYEGTPLEGALVVAFNRHTPAQQLAFRTDCQGRGALRLPRGGVWLVKTVHMIPAPGDTGADWESLWASLTFELPW